MADIEIRAAHEADIPAVELINRYYILNTVLTFHEERQPTENYVKTFHAVAAAGLPYLVAVDASAAASSSAPPILGYAFALGFRPERAAYRHTVEFALFCDPEQRGRGVGSKLLATLIEVLREPSKYPQYFPDSGGNVELRKVRHLIAVMAVDETGKRGGLALKEFYERHGFQLRGHLRQVGYKFDRWIDVMEMQLSYY